MTIQEKYQEFRALMFQPWVSATEFDAACYAMWQRWPSGQGKTITERLADARNMQELYEADTELHTHAAKNKARAYLTNI